MYVFGFVLTPNVDISPQNPVIVQAMVSQKEASQVQSNS